MSYPVIAKNTDSQNAEDVPTDVSSFGGLLGAGDVDVQAALDVLDDHLHDDRYYTETEVNALLAARSESIKTTAITESIDTDLYTVIRQTASGITTTLTSLTTNSAVTIKNRSGGNNIINHTVDGVATPTIYDGESFRLVYNGTDFDIL